MPACLPLWDWCGAECGGHATWAPPHCCSPRVLAGTQGAILLRDQRRRPTPLHLLQTLRSALAGTQGVIYAASTSTFLGAKAVDCEGIKNVAGEQQQAGGGRAGRAQAWGWRGPGTGQGSGRGMAGQGGDRAGGKTPPPGTGAWGLLVSARLQASSPSIGPRAAIITFCSGTLTWLPPTP